ncbi:MAG: zinc ribbon domain-containing protein [Candidatus Eisenbacteria bacterium]|nr:zinc ribbon domain-containing protein [Candidatus Eisenbacteria bacterium]
MDLGLEPFMVASSLLGVVSMRLVRTPCPRCRESYEANAANLNRLMAGGHGEGTLTLQRGRGCGYCHSTGYHGRTGIFELLEVDEKIRSLIVGGSPDSTIRQSAVESGMSTIGEDGLKKVMAGVTTLEEVTRVVYLSDQMAKSCPSCTTVLAHEFEYCTGCGEFVGQHCEACQRRMQPNWTFCPHCGSDTTRSGEAESETRVAGVRHQSRARLALPGAQRKAS